MNYQIFTEVTVDMTEEMLAACPSLHIIPMNVTLGGQDYLYGPGGNLTIEEFYARERAGEFASTSQISPYAYMQQFEPVLKEGQDILYLCFSSGLSDTYETACTTAADLREAYPDRRIEVVDTLCAAGGEGMLVYEVMQRYAQGAGMDELISQVESCRLKICHWFTVDTFDHLLHGGRVSAASATVGSLLNIKPLLHMDDPGRLEVMGKPRGRKQAIRRLKEKLMEGYRPDLGRYVVIGHGDCPETAQGLKDDILAAYPDAQIEISYIDPVIGAHTGPDILALMYWGDNR